jgi:hypothetical protein
MTLEEWDSRVIQAELKGGYVTCPKCDKFSGDDWSQCKGSCPVPGSPHFDESI